MPFPHAGQYGPAPPFSDVGGDTPAGTYGAGEPMTIVTRDTLSPASLYVDRVRTGGAQVGNTVLTDGVGNVTIFTEPGRYYIIAKDGVQQPITVYPDPDDLAASAGLGIVPVTAWQPSTVYTAGQVVTFTGQTWGCVTPHTSRPSFDGTEQANWTLMASGASGSTPAVSVTGPPNWGDAPVVGSSASGWSAGPHVHGLPADPRGMPILGTGRTGAVAFADFGGGTASGAPASGPWLKGEFVVDQTGAMWICTVAGTPGTWVRTSDAAKGLPLGLTGATAATRFAGGTASGAPASGTFAVGDYDIDQTGSMWICTIAGTPGTWVRTSDLAKGQPAGLTGATAATRYVGATASGAPATGAFLVGDFVVDQTGFFWICTTAGTPGTWGQLGAAGINWRTPTTIQATTAYALNDGLQDAGGSYRCILAYTTGGSPTVPSADATHWTFIAQQGTAGTNGSTGAPGVNWRSPATIQASTAYALNDGLQDAGGTWRCILAYTTGLSPTLPSNDATHWTYVALQGTTGVAGTGITWRSPTTIQPSTAYALNDGLQDAGGSWRCVSAYTTPSSSVTTPSNDPTHWTFVAQQGVTGAAGPPLPTVNAVATSNVAALSGTVTIDGLALVAGQVVLLVAQTTGSQNGPWTIAAGAWTRPSWFVAASSQLGVGTIVLPGSTTWGSTEWFLTNTTSVTVDTTAETWAILPPAVIQNTHANRPAATAWNRNLVYFETDTGLEYQNWSGSAWTQITSGTELAFAAITTNPTTTATAFADVAGLSITLVAPSRPFYLEFWGLLETTTANTVCNIEIDDSANVRIASTGTPVPVVAGSNAFPSAVVKARLPSGAYAITPGNSYTFKVRIATVTAGNLVGILGGANWPAWLAAVAA